MSYVRFIVFRSKFLNMTSDDGHYQWIFYKISILNSMDHLSLFVYIAANKFICFILMSMSFPILTFSSLLSSSLD